jgi:hypothetical protein
VPEKKETKCTWERFRRGFNGIEFKTACGEQYYDQRMIPRADRINTAFNFCPGCGKKIRRRYE